MHDAGTLSDWGMRPQRPDLPQPRFLRLGQCHHVTGMDTVGSSGRESDGRRPSLSSPFSPAWEGETGRTSSSECALPGAGGADPGGARRHRRGRALPEAAVA